MFQLICNVLNNMHVLQSVTYFMEHEKYSTKNVSTYWTPGSSIHAYLVEHEKCSKKYASMGQTQEEDSLMHILWNTNSVPLNMHEYWAQGSSKQGIFCGTSKMFQTICKPLSLYAYFLEHEKCSTKNALLTGPLGRVFMHIQWNTRNVPKNMHYQKSR